MIIVKLQGGLGNQMFQYAFGLSISQKLKGPVAFDTSFFDTQQAGTDIALRQLDLQVFTDDVATATKSSVNSFLNPGKLQKVINKLNINQKTVYRELSLKAIDTAFEQKTPVYFDGYWQSENYFKAFEQAVRKSFTFKKELNTKSQKLAGEIAGRQNAVSIHIRRGDYVSSERTNMIHGTCSKTYYLNAIALIAKQAENPYFYIFTDDAVWAKQNLLPVISTAVLIDHNKDSESWQDMALMSQCRHHIIANSSFSWWGAWLGNSKDKMVVAPKNWFNTPSYYFDDSTIVPQEWLKLAND